MKYVTALLRSSPVVSLFICGLIVLLIMAMRGRGNLESTELAAYDLFIRLLPKATSPNPRITLITITEEDIQNLGQWPLTDATLAKALKILTQYKARAIGVDIFRDIPVPPGREELDSVLIESPEIIVVMKFGSGGISPPSALRGTEQFGFNDLIIDSGGILRRALIFLDDGETVGYSFALRLALLYLKAEGISPQADDSNPDNMRLGNTTIRPFESNDGAYVGADARGYQFLMDFKETASSFKSFSLLALLHGEVDPQEIKGKVVILGVAAKSVKDFFYTPYSSSLEADEQVLGITAHAHILSQLIRIGLNESQPIETTGKPFDTCWIILWSLAGGGAGLWVRSPLRFTVTASFFLSLLILIAYCAFLRGWWIPLVPPAMSLLCSAGIVTAHISSHEKRLRAFLMHIFSRHVSKEVAENIWQQREKFSDGGRPRAQRMVVTTLFTDLRGFTPIAENMDPMALIDWLNTYMESMANLVSKHGGVVDDYAGDGIKANFGVPVARTSEDEIRQDAINAVNCALAMGKEMCRLNALWKEQNLPTVGARVGIFTGPVVAGALGSAQRLKYTTIGNTVNTAARLESFKQALESDGSEILCRILIGDATLHYVRDQFETEGIGKLKLKGLDKDVDAYRVLCAKMNCTDINSKEEKP